MNTSAIVTRVDASALPANHGNTPSFLSESSAPAAGGAGRMFAVVRRYWWLAAIIWLVIGIPATIAIYSTVKPTYEANGAVRIAPVQSNLINGSKDQTPFYSEFLRTQADFLKSSRVLQRAAEDPRLKAYSWFRELPDQVGYLSANVQAITSNQLVRISITHTDPRAAADMVNAVIDAYDRLIREDEENNSGRSLTILRNLRETTEKFLREAQQKRADLQADGESLSAEDERKISGDLLAATRANLAKIETEVLTLKSQLEHAREKPAPDEEQYKKSLPMDNDNQVVAMNAEKLRLELADNVLASRKATPDHPDRKEFRKQMKVIEQKIDARRAQVRDNNWKQFMAGFQLEKDRKVADIEADIKAAEMQRDAMASRVAEQEKTTRTLAGRVQPLLTLNEQIAEAKESLKRYNDRIQEQESKSVASGIVSIGWSAAVPMTPEKDRRPKMAATANGVGLMLGLAVLVVLTRLRNRIESTEDLPDSIRPLVIGSVSQAPRTATQNQLRKQILSEEMRLVHANLLPPGRPTRRIMMVTSPTPGNGKTSIAAHLAISMAKSGMEVLLIDADMRKRDLTAMFDVGFRPGLCDFLQGQAPELVRPMQLLPNFSVMGAGSPITRNPVELYQRRHLRECLEQFGDQFDCIVIDTPPTLVVADARLIAQSADEVLCVVRSQVSHEREISQTIDALSRVTGEKPKIIVNGVEQRLNYYKHRFSYASHTKRSANPGDRPSAPLTDVLE